MLEFVKGECVTIETPETVWSFWEEFLTTLQILKNVYPVLNRAKMKFETVCMLEGAGSNNLFGCLLNLVWPHAIL